jgi:mRNA-degrading endonuclease YafQ of YafQ-DinJ toxin-antitoxin module
MFKIQFNKNSAKKVKKLLLKNPQLLAKLSKATDTLKEDPFYPSLKTHTVNSKNYGEKYSSWITGDLRFIWEFNEENSQLEIIEILDVGGHTGGKSVY